MQDNAVLMPNTTQVPNLILDNLPVLTDTELRILLVVTRQTLGWSKARDWLTHSQIEQRTGKGHASISSAIKSLSKKGLLSVSTEDGTELVTPEQRQTAGGLHKKFFYALNVTTPIQNLEGAHPKFREGPIQNLNTTKPTHIQNPTLTKRKETDANASGQAREPIPPTAEGPTVGGVSPSSQLGQSGAPVDDVARKRAEFLAGIHDKPPKTRADYLAAVCGLARRTRWYDYIEKEHGFSLAQFLARVVNKGFNGSNTPPPLAQVRRLLESMVAAEEIPRPEKEVEKAWPWYARRVQAIMESECKEVPPFDFRWTHPARGKLTWRDLLCPKVPMR
jgi:hypothetical protein